MFRLVHLYDRHSEWECVDLNSRHPTHDVRSLPPAAISEHGSMTGWQRRGRRENELSIRSRTPMRAVVAAVSGVALHMAAIEEWRQGWTATPSEQ